MKIESFQWRGKTKEGVSKWEGSQEGPPRLIGKIFVGYGRIAGVVGLALAFALLLGKLPPGLTPVMAVGLIHGSVFTGLGLWINTLRRTIQRLQPVEKVAESLQTDSPTIARLAVEKGIKPRMNINGRDYYEIGDFNESRTLLRGSSAPAATPETLLRAASSDSAFASDNLLRAANKDEAASTPVDETRAVSSPQWQAKATPQTLEIRSQ